MQNPSIPKLAAKMAVSESTIKRAIAELKKNGAIEVFRGSRRDSNRYTLPSTFERLSGQDDLTTGNMRGQIERDERSKRASETVQLDPYIDIAKAIETNRSSTKRKKDVEAGLKSIEKTFGTIGPKVRAFFEYLEPKMPDFSLPCVATETRAILAVLREIKDEDAMLDAMKTTIDRNAGLSDCLNLARDLAQKKPFGPKPGADRRSA